MQQAPVLLIGFNRPDRLIRLIDSLRPLAPPVIRIAIDGPRSTVERDTHFVRETAETAYQVDWTTDLSVHVHPKNLGITEAIPWAVSWVLEHSDRVIVIEDDVTIGSQFVEFANTALMNWEDGNQTMAISGYNMVPESNISNPHLASRLDAIRSRDEMGPTPKLANLAKDYRISHSCDPMAAVIPSRSKQPRDDVGLSMGAEHLGSWRSSCGS